MDASITHFPPAGASGGEPGAGDLEEGLFSRVREHAEAMIRWARSDEALALEHEKLEERAMADGLELMRLLAWAHLELREPRRDDVQDADGDLRRTAEDGQEDNRIMTFAPVRTCWIAYRKKGKANLYPHDAELNGPGLHSFSAGVGEAVRAGPQPGRAAHRRRVRRGGRPRPAACPALARRRGR